MSVVKVEVQERIATVTLNRPAARNALSGEVLRLLPSALGELDQREDVDVVILTGTDPAFCAGLDLRELGSTDNQNARGDRAGATSTKPFPPMTKPLIGAVNGPAVTGGLELALNCDFLVASERATFADTHARVGVMPGWGLTVLLPQAIGVRRAREMSYTGNFVSATQAIDWGLVNHVVPHEELLPFTRSLALDVAGNDQDGVRQIRSTYGSVTATTVAEGWVIEARESRAWQQSRFDPDEVARRRAAIIERGRAQV